jgi:hypothetical protein
MEPSSSEKKPVAQNLHTKLSTRQHFRFSFGLGVFVAFVARKARRGFVIGLVVRNGFRLYSVWGVSVAFVAHAARKA